METAFTLRRFKGGRAIVRGRAAARWFVSPARITVGCAMSCLVKAIVTELTGPRLLTMVNTCSRSSNPPPLRNG